MGKKTRPSVVSAKNADGTSASANNLDYPPVAIRDNIAQFPFIVIARSMRNRSLPTLCSRRLP
jgi:hypothetical protein